MKDLIIYHHLGLGDHIICNGLVRYHAERRHVLLLCKLLQNHPSVAWMFSDHPNILTVGVSGDDGAENFISERGDRADVLRVTGSGNSFDEHFYVGAQVPYEFRWSAYFAPRYPGQHRFPPYPFCFIHDDATRGFIIKDQGNTDLPIIRPVYHPLMPILFSWQDVLERAEEIHCIPSSFSVLVDSLPDVPDQKLFLHASARPGCELPTYRKNWKVL